MRVLLTGATGTIGRAVVTELRGHAHEVRVLTRDAPRARERLGADVEAHVWSDPAGEAPPADAIRGAQAVIHLMGEPIAQRWTDDARRRIRASRVDATRQLVAGLRAAPEPARPGVLISQSATGFYGARDDTPLDEDARAGEDWLARLVVDWEQAAATAVGSMRVVRARTGVVLSPEGGALAKMLPFFRAGVGGPVAGGRQYVSWIHLEDVAAGIVACLENDAAEGPVNLTAPDPATNAELSRALGAALHRPAVLPVPAVALRALYGEMAEIVITGQRVVPTRLLALGHRFRHPALGPALQDVLARG
jgi:uncharacterized protein (TIGR01777 family)